MCFFNQKHRVSTYLPTFFSTVFVLAELGLFGKPHHKKEEAPRSCFFSVFAVRWKWGVRMYRQARTRRFIIICEKKFSKFSSMSSSTVRVGLGCGCRECVYVCVYSAKSRLMAGVFYQWMTICSFGVRRVNCWWRAVPLIDAQNCTRCIGLRKLRRLFKGWLVSRRLCHDIILQFVLIHEGSLTV